MKWKKYLAGALSVAMMASMTACGGKGNDENPTPTPGDSGVTPAATSGASQENPTTPQGEENPTTPNSGDEATPTPEVDVNANWDGAYMDGDDYRAYIGHDLEQLAFDLQDQLTADQKTAVEAAKAAGLDAIAQAGTVAEVRAAYDNAYKAIVQCIPVANGLISFAGESIEEKTNMLGILETYGIRNNITGLSMYENGGCVMYNPRITLGTENYIVGYGFGILAEGAITADLDYESNPDWKRYYHSLNASDPGTLNYLNDQGSEVGDFYSYISESFYTIFMNATKDGYDWTPAFAMEMPVPLNEENGTATKWRFQVRTGAEGLKYTTGSQIPSRAAFNNRDVALEDYETAFKLLITQKNDLYRGAEMANQSNSGAIVGVKAYYDGSANGYNEDLWKNVGIKTYVEDGKSYFEVEFVTPLSRFYAMYYISSSLYMPVPQEFLDLVTVQNYLGFNNDATETPVDNSLSLGAFYLEAYNQDQEVVYKKNPNYVFADTKYSVEGVHIRILPAMKDDREASINEFLAGHTDSASIPQTRLDEYRNDPRTRQTTGDSVFKLNVNATDPETWELLFGEEGVVAQTPKAEYWEVEPALANEHFTKALGYTIDRLTFANARGSIPSVDYLSSNYMSDPENGVPYTSTEAHKKAVAPRLEETDGYGYSLELAREYFRVALTELENEGAYTPGTAENPTVIDLEIAWMYPSNEEGYHNEIKSFFETAFNDPSVSGGKYQLSANFWVGNDWSDVYYHKVLVGQYDIGFGSISGNSLDPLSFMNILSVDQSIANGFTLNFGINTNDPDAYPLVYRGERYSYDAFYNAANGQAIVVNGVNDNPVSVSYESIVKNDDGSYTGAFEFRMPLPDLTTVTPVRIVCCEYERAYNGDGGYEETDVEFTTEDKGNGVIRVTFTVPADLAADYATGSGTSENPQGMTGFDFTYDYTFNGTDHSGNMKSVDDTFEVQ